MSKATAQPNEEAPGAPLPEPSRTGGDARGGPLPPFREWVTPAATRPKAGAEEERYPAVGDLPTTFLETGEDYPSTDGRPMSDANFHAPVIHYGKYALPHHYQGKREVYIGGDLLIYLDSGNRRLRVSPDLFAAFGSPPGKREVYKVWEEPGGTPQFVLEVASRGTVRYDRTKKKDLHASLGVQECWLFDPRAQYLVPPLQGFHLVDGAYRPLPPGASVQGGACSVRSKVLGLDLCPMGEELRFHRQLVAQLPGGPGQTPSGGGAHSRIGGGTAQLASMKDKGPFKGLFPSRRQAEPFLLDIDQLEALAQQFAPAYADATPFWISLSTLP